MTGGEPTVRPRAVDVPCMWVVEPLCSELLLVPCADVALVLCPFAMPTIVGNRLPSGRMDWLAFSFD